MEYQTIRRGVFRSRPNRFIALVELDGQIEVCHVKNTGRCKELLTDGAPVYLERSGNPARKTKYSLVAVEKNGLLINMDSQAPNAAVAEWLPRSGLFQQITLLKREAVYGSSRFDFYVEADGRSSFLEVKGVTLEEDGVVLFPDAPTQRGRKHLLELCGCAAQGLGAYVVFVAQMEQARYFTPNRARDPAFAAALEQARDAGVEILAVCCHVTANTMEIARRLPVRF